MVHPVDHFRPEIGLQGSPFGANSAVTHAACTLSPQERLKTRRRITFSKTMHAIYNSTNVSLVSPSDKEKSGRITTEPVRFSSGRYSRQRSQQRLSRGEEFRWKEQWIDSSEKRARLAKRLRNQLQQREAERSNNPLTEQQKLDLEQSNDFRPALYRHILLLELMDGTDLKVPTSQWATNHTKKAIETASKLFRDVYRNSRHRITVDDPSASPATESGSVSPDFRPMPSSTTDEGSRNPNVHAPLEGEHPGSTSDSPSGCFATGKLCGARHLGAVSEWIVDSGADTHLRSFENHRIRSSSGSF